MNLERRYSGSRPVRFGKVGCIRCLSSKNQRERNTDVDMSQEKRIDDYWIVDSSRHFANSWRGFTKFTLLNEKNLQKDTCGPGGD